MAGKIKREYADSYWGSRAGWPKRGEGGSFQHAMKEFLKARLKAGNTSKIRMFMEATIEYQKSETAAEIQAKLARAKKRRETEIAKLEAKLNALRGK